MRVCLFEDRDVGNLEPLVWTRPAFELLSGCTSLARKQCRFFQASEVGALVRPYLAGLCQEQQPSMHWNDPAWLASERTIMVNARWLPPAEFIATLSEPCVGLIDDEVVFAIVEPEHLAGCCTGTIDDCVEVWKRAYPSVQAGGRLIRYLWELVQINATQIRDDQQRFSVPRQESAVKVAVVGPAHQLTIDPRARLDPMVVADCTRGPIIIDQDAVVTAFSRLEGPCFIGRGTHVLGARIRAGTTLGPQCRVGGEVEASILQGFSNKYHDGFLGHSYVGEWVNFGAGTNNSDLRNDYGVIAVPVRGEPVNTGLTKVGCFIGDHTKTGLGTLLNSGSSVGICCNLLPAGQLLPKYFPSFCSWWNSTLTANANISSLMRTAAEVMARRECQFTEGHAALYQSVFERTADERRRMILETEGRRLRRSA